MGIIFSKGKQKEESFIMRKEKNTQKIEFVFTTNPKIIF